MSKPNVASETAKLREEIRHTEELWQTAVRERDELRARVEAMTLQLRSVEAATDLETARRRAIV